MIAVVILRCSSKHSLFIFDFFFWWIFWFRQFIETWKIWRTGNDRSNMKYFGHKKIIYILLYICIYTLTFTSNQCLCVDGQRQGESNKIIVQKRHQHQKQQQQHQRQQQLTATTNEWFSNWFERYIYINIYMRRGSVSTYNKSRTFFSGRSI